MLKSPPRAHAQSFGAATGSFAPLLHVCAGSATGPHHKHQELHENFLLIAPFPVLDRVETDHMLAEFAETENVQVVLAESFPDVSRQRLHLAHAQLPFHGLVLEAHVVPSKFEDLAIASLVDFDWG